MVCVADNNHCNDGSQPAGRASPHECGAVLDAHTQATSRTTSSKAASRRCGIQRTTLGGKLACCSTLVRTASKPAATHHRDGASGRLTPVLRGPRVDAVRKPGSDIITFPEMQGLFKSSPKTLVRVLLHHSCWACQCSNVGWHTCTAGLDVQNGRDRGADERCVASGLHLQQHDPRPNVLTGAFAF